MMTEHETFKTRQAMAMLEPQGEHEVSLVALYRELSTLADRYRNDHIMLPAVVEPLAETASRLAADGETGRIDPSTYMKQLRDVVRRAGGNTDGI